MVEDRCAGREGVGGKVEVKVEVEGKVEVKCSTSTSTLPSTSLHVYFNGIPV